MKHLATRIFLAFFVTLLVTGAGAVSLTSWVLDERETALRTEMLSAAKAAADALASGGREGLLAWSRARAADPLPALDILLIDESGGELLGRRLPDSLAVRREVVEDWPADLPTVFLDLPRESPLLTSAEGEVFRLLSTPRRGGLGLWRDLPLQVLLLSLLVTALASWILARSITRPISKLQHTTLALAAGRLETRVEAGTLRRADEIGGLARSLEGMAMRLDSLLRGQKQLLRDLSHELRSPLARIRLASGLLGQQGATSNPLLSRIDDEVTQLDGLIERILEVAKLESGASEWRREPLDLCGLLERTLADAAFEAAQLGIALRTSLPAQPMVIDGDRHWVQSAVENVVRNALRHTPAGAVVEVTLEAESAQATLRVRDNGPGLAASELSKIFEPFYRGRGNPRTGGVGLGLAIVARVLQGHGGTVEARNLRNAAGEVGGFEIALRWPLDLKPSPAGRAADEPAARVPHSPR